MTYRVAVRREFTAQHFLIGGDWGLENELHQHSYAVEIQVEGETLDRHGYLVDIVAIEAGLDDLTGYYADRTLNDLPEFSGLNPSIEHFSRILCEAILARLPEAGFSSVTARIWENDDAWASYRVDI